MNFYRDFLFDIFILNFSFSSSIIALCNTLCNILLESPLYNPFTPDLIKIISSIWIIFFFEFFPCWFTLMVANGYVAIVATNLEKAPDAKLS